MLDIGNAMEGILAKKRANYKRYNRTRFDKRLAEDPVVFCQEMRDTNRRRRQDPIFRAKEREQDELRKRKAAANKRVIENLPSEDGELQVPANIRVIAPLPSEDGELSTTLPLEPAEVIGETEKPESWRLQKRKHACFFSRC